jgi:hypothetical protein
MNPRTAQHQNRRRAQRAARRRAQHAARNAQLDAELARYSVKRWLSISQWARARGVSVWFAYAQAREGRLKIMKAGRRSLITPEADRAWSNSLPSLNPLAVVNHDAISVEPPAPATPLAT